MTDMDTIPAPATETPPPANDVVAKQLPRWALIGLFLYASVFTLSYAKDFLVPIVLAYLLAMVFGPIRRFFDRRGVPSALTSLVIVLVLLVGFLSLLGALAVPVSGWMERAPQIQHDIQSKLSSISQTFSGVFDATRRLSELTKSHSAGVQQVEVNDTSYLANAALFAPAAMAQFVFTLILLLFLLASGDMFYEKLVNVLPTFGDKKRAMRIAHDIERKLSRYLLTITLINAGFGVAVAVLLWAVGMPSPIVFGVLAFLLNYVPYLGALAGIVVSMSVALVSFDGPGWSLVVGAIYLGGHRRGPAHYAVLRRPEPAPEHGGRLYRGIVLGMALVGGRHAGGRPSSRRHKYVLRTHRRSQRSWKVPLRALLGTGNRRRSGSVGFRHLGTRRHSG